MKLKRLPGPALAPVIALVIGAGAAAEDPGWDLDVAAYQSTMTITGALVIDGRRSVGETDKVAAFVGGEVRGVATPIDVGGAMTFFLTVYANTSGEEVTFKAYSAEADRVFDAFETLTFVPNAVHGTVSEPFVWSVSPLSGCARGRPDWTVLPSAFQSSMSVTAAVSVDTGTQAGSGDLLAAFAGDELRGVATPVSASDGRLFFLTVYANTPGEKITFRLYEEASDAVYSTAESLTFEANAVNGTPGSPLSMTAACPAIATAVEPNRQAPVHASIQHSAYPNPFRDAVTVLIALSAPSRVEVTLYDVRGRAVRRWVDGQLSSGSRSVRLDAADLPAGVYIYRIRAGSFNASGRMTLVR